MVSGFVKEDNVDIIVDMPRMGGCFCPPQAQLSDAIKAVIDQHKQYAECGLE